MENSTIEISSRYSSSSEARKTLEAYLAGARDGVVGHFTTYPPVLDTTSCTGAVSESLLTNELVGLYLHWPYCFLPNKAEKCDFCMCNTKNDEHSRSLRKQYFNTLIQEIELYSNKMGVNHKPAECLYIGGGTPLTMSEREIDILFLALRESLLINADTLITIETRPEIINEKKIKALQRNNVRRISIGIESLDDSLAVSMGRIKTGENYYTVVKKSMDILKNYQIPFINMDIIYGHPRETKESVLGTLRQVLSFSPDSLSVYPLGLPSELTVIEKVIQNGLSIKSLEYRYELSTAITEYMKGHNYEQVSDCIWSRTKRDSYKTSSDGRSVVNFWNQTCVVPYGTWLGFGVGSIGYIEGRGYAQNTNDLEEYLRLIPSGNLAVQSFGQNSTEELMRGEIAISILHRVIDLERFTSHFGAHPLSVFPVEFQMLKETGCIELEDNKVRLTEQAVPYSQGIARFFFSPEAESKYRLTERRRVDYSLYGVCYENLK